MANAGLTQSGEEPGSYAGPPGSRARRQEQGSASTAGIESPRDSVMPTGVTELEPDPLGETQGPGAEGELWGPSTGERVSVDALAWVDRAAVSGSSTVASAATGTRVAEVGRN